MEINLYTMGDSASIYTWSNLPYFFSKALIDRGVRLNRIDILPTGNLLYRCWQAGLRLWAAAMLRLDGRKRNREPCHDPISILMIERKIRKETRKHPNARLNLFLTFSFSSHTFSPIPVAQYCDETYELLLEDTERKRRPMDRWLIRRETGHLQHANHIFTTGNRCADFIRARYGLRNVRVLPSGVNLETPPEINEAEVLAAKRENKMILFIGIGVQKRGIDVLLEAFRIFNRKNSDEFTLHLVGPLRDTMDISDRHVNCHGYLNKGNPAELATYLNLLKTARLFVMPMREGPLPGVIKEAGLMYTPVVTTNIWQVSDIIKDGVNGMLLDRPLAEDFADRMHALVNDLPTWERMAKNSHRMAQSYSWDHTVQIFWDEVFGTSV